MAAELGLNADRCGGTPRSGQDEEGWDRPAIGIQTARALTRWPSMCPRPSCCPAPRAASFHPPFRPRRAVPIGDEWVHEIRHDGYRLMARRDASGIRSPLRLAGRRYAMSTASRALINLSPLHNPLPSAISGLEKTTACGEIWKR
jgi:hypothetical protein